MGACCGVHFRLVVATQFYLDNSNEGRSTYERKTNT